MAARTWQTGPKGGKFYITATGQKMYGQEALDASRQETQQTKLQAVKDSGAREKQKQAEALSKLAQARGSKEAVSFEIALPENTQKTVASTLGGLVEKYPELHGIRITGGAPDGTVAIAARNRILLNPDAWHPSTLEKHAKEWDGIRIDASPTGIIAHEAGHVLDNHIREKIGNDRYYGILEKHFPGFLSQESWRKNATSLFGQENSSEFMAEAFSSVQQNRHALGNTPGADHMLASAKNMWSDLVQASRQKK